MNFIEQILISEVVSDNIRIFYAVPHNVLYLGLIHSKKVKMCSSPVSLLMDWKICA